MDRNKKHFSTVKDLRALAKRRGLKGYSRLKKAELVQLLTPANIMDEPVPNVGQAPLIPQAMTKAEEKIHDLEKWITSYMPTLKAIGLAIKPFKEKIMALYNQPKIKPVLKEQAVRGWFQTYEIQGLPKHDLESFVKLVKSKVLTLLKSPRKVKIFLFCEMEKVNITSGETVLKIMLFRSSVEIVLESTDVSELHDLMIEKAKKNITALNARGSN